MSQMLIAGLWGLVGGLALVIGALAGVFLTLPRRLIAGIMAAGAGVLIAAVAFDLMEEAFARGGLRSTALGFVGGAVAYTIANMVVSRRGARHRKRSGADPDRRPAAAGAANAGLALAIGALLDGVPESLVIGASLIGGEGVSVMTVVAVFLSNLPEGLSSAAGMKQAGHRRRSILLLWSGIALASGVAAMGGNGLLAGASPRTIAAVTAIAAGAILAMLVDTMIPEATAETHDASGLIAAGGFLAAFVLSKAGG